MTVDQIEKLTEFNPNGTTQCDRCGSSRAYVRFIKEDLDLLACGHHASQWELALISSGWSMQDRRDVLEEEVRKYNTVNPDDDNF